MIAAAHPLDRAKLMRLGELMCDVSAGRLSTRAPLVPLVENLMVCLRDDCSAAGSELVVDRLLSIACAGLGADGNAAMAEGLILASSGYANRFGPCMGAA
jgi:hypothetical protein